MEKLLSKVNGPSDLKKLSVDELKVLAEEIRDVIVETVSRTGGHLASNLGIVELTLALHYAFDFSRDRLLWDVGHQCYTHKIITGRKEQFGKLRHADGVSGFPNPAESDYDVFSVGHAGTAIASAIGLALGKKQQDKDEKIVAVVGDASIVNGLSFEGLNNLGLVKRQMLIVLNDNSMAIDNTVGAVAKYFSRVRLSQTYEDMKKSSKNILEHMPGIGKGMEEAMERLKKTIRMVMPASQMFESLNIPYYGPVDGHDIGALTKVFEAMSHLDRPVILHVYTKKGKGFMPAEEDKSKYHSTGPFNLDVGNGGVVEPEAEKIQLSFTDVFGKHLAKLAERDKKIVAITSAMCDGTGLGEFRAKFADRFYDVGIAESAAVDIAAGLAREGMKPVVCIYSTFLQRSFDQIFQEVALQNLPVVFCIDRAGAVGSDGPTHHGLMDIGFLRMLPNAVLIAPANEAEMELALEFAIESGRMVCIRYPKDKVDSPESEFPACGERFGLGKSIVVRRSKKADVVIVSYGAVLGEVMKAAETLSQNGIEAEVINARFASPIDEKILGYIRAGKKVVTVEDHGIACGFGSAVLEEAAKSADVGNRNILILGAPKDFIKHELRKSQLMEMSVTADKITDKVKSLLIS